VIRKIVQLGFVGLILFIATACSGPNAGVTSGKHKVWVQSDTGSHLGGRWVEVGETGSAATASNVQRASAEALQQVPSAGNPPSGATGSGR